jgi:hypothetical protein
VRWRERLEELLGDAVQVIEGAEQEVGHGVCWKWTAGLVLLRRMGQTRWWVVGHWD